MTEDLMTPGQVASYLSVAEQTLANWRSKGEGPRYVRVGTSVRYKREAIESWLKIRTVGSTREGK
jgi:excisionase family DNA binding protein